MSSGGIGRRRLLLASAGAALMTPLAAACASGTDEERVEFRSPTVTDTPSAKNVRDFGAVGDGVADDTDAVLSAFADAGERVVVYFPAGNYRVSRWPEMVDYTAVLGDGGDVSTVIYDGDATLIELRNKQRINFRRLGFFATRNGSTVVSLANCFRCSFDSVVIRGNHSSGTYPDFLDQRGVVLSENTGGTSFVNCDINNFGTGVVTSCIQNYLTSSKLTSNYVGVLGTGNDFNAGLSFANVEFVSDNDPNTTDTHLRIDGASNDWWLANVWFEGCDKAVVVGEPGRGGPAQFGMVNCKVAARTICIDLRYCRQPYLANVRFDPDPDRQPVELRIDAAGCAHGTAVGLVSSAADDIALDTFPPGWIVTGRGVASAPTFVGTVVARGSTEGVDLVQARTVNDELVAAVLPSGTWLSERSDGGVVLKDSAGAYWRLTVETDGSVRTSSLGEVRPT